MGGLLLHRERSRTHLTEYLALLRIVVTPAATTSMALMCRWKSRPSIRSGHRRAEARLHDFRRAVGGNRGPLQGSDQPALGIAARGTRPRAPRAGAPGEGNCRRGPAAPVSAILARRAWVSTGPSECWQMQSSSSMAAVAQRGAGLEAGRPLCLMFPRVCSLPARTAADHRSATIVKFNPIRSPLISSAFTAVLAGRYTVATGLASPVKVSASAPVISRMLRR